MSSMTWYLIQLSLLRRPPHDSLNTVGTLLPLNMLFSLSEILFPAANCDTPLSLTSSRSDFPYPSPHVTQVCTPIHNTHTITLLPYILPPQHLPPPDKLVVCCLSPPSRLQTPWDLEICFIHRKMFSEQCLTHNRCSLNTYWMNWINEWL